MPIDRSSEKRIHLVSNITYSLFDSFGTVLLREPYSTVVTYLSSISNTDHRYTSQESSNNDKWSSFSQTRSTFVTKSTNQLSIYKKKKRHDLIKSLSRYMHMLLTGWTNKPDNGPANQTKAVNSFDKSSDKR